MSVIFQSNPYFAQPKLKLALGDGLSRFHTHSRPRGCCPRPRPGWSAGCSGRKYACEGKSPFRAELPARPSWYILEIITVRLYVGIAHRLLKDYFIKLIPFAMMTCLRYLLHLPTIGSLNWSRSKIQLLKWIQNCPLIYNPSVYRRKGSFIVAASSNECL